MTNTTHVTVQTSFDLVSEVDENQQVRRGGFRWSWLFIVAVIGLALYFLPTSFGGSSTMIQVEGRSMEPTYSTGDLVGLRATGDYQVNDVVAYQVPAGQPGEGMTVIHRIIGMRVDGSLVLQGDNNDFIDGWTITPADVLGEEEFVLPHFAQVATSNWTLAALLAFAGVYAMFAFDITLPQLTWRRPMFV